MNAHQGDAHACQVGCRRRENAGGVAASIAATGSGSTVWRRQCDLRQMGAQHRRAYPTTGHSAASNVPPRGACRSRTQSGRRPRALLNPHRIGIRIHRPTATGITASDVLALNANRCSWHGPPTRLEEQQHGLVCLPLPFAVNCSNPTDE